jgi:hypothetical protein
MKPFPSILQSEEDKRHGRKASITTRQPESVADFKQRICIMMRERETGKKYSLVGASRADECVLRKTKPPTRKETHENGND